MWTKRQRDIKWMDGLTDRQIHRRVERETDGQTDGDRLVVGKANGRKGQIIA